MRRDLASRAVLIAAGVGTALGAGAGLANAAPLEQDLQQNDAGQNAFDQSAAPAGALGSLPVGPDLLTGGLAPTKAAGPLDLPAVGGDQLAALGGLGGMLGGGATDGATDGSGSSTDGSGSATDSTDGSGSATDSTDSTDSTDGTDGTDSATDSATDGSGTASPSATDADSAAPSSTGSTGGSTAPSSGGGYTTHYSS